MAKEDFNANICEINQGAYYKVHLEWIPRVGDLIDLYSHLDKADGYDAKHHYEVVTVVHQVHDITDKDPASTKGYHFPVIHVKKIESPFFG